MDIRGLFGRPDRPRGRWALNAAARLALAATIAVTLAACGGDDDDTGGPPPEGVVEDFTLKDVNPNSTRFDQDVSPRDYLEKVSGWYFGAAT